MLPIRGKGIYFPEWIVSFAPQAAWGLDGRGTISGTRFLWCSAHGEHA
jgi:hypothetical protein